MKTKRFCKQNFTSALILLGLSSQGHLAYAQTPTLSSRISVLPDFDNPKLQFGTGKVERNRPQISPVLPNIPGHASGWIVTQWNQSALLSGGQMNTTESEDTNSLKKITSYSFLASDGHSYVKIFPESYQGHTVFELFEKDGTLRNGGGSNLFLSAAPRSPWPTLDKNLQLSVSARLSQAIVNYSTPMAETSGAVLGMAFAGFVIDFLNPTNGTKSTLFLQLPITNSRSHTSFLVSCRENNGTLRLLAGGSLSGMMPLAFKAGNNPFQEIHYNITDYVKMVFRTPISCVSHDGVHQMVSLQTVDLSQAAVGNFYIGLETQNKDERPDSKNSGAQGSVSLGLELSNLQLLQSNN